MTKHWWGDLDPDLDDATIAANAAKLALEIEGWREDAERRTAEGLKAAAAVRNVVTIEEAFQDMIEDARLDKPPAIVHRWHDLDYGRPITAGELVLIAARPGVGKTWVLLELLEETLRQDPKAAVAMLEMEMLPRHLAERLAGHAMRLNPMELAARAKKDLTLPEILSEAHYLAGRMAVLPKSLAVSQLPEAIDAVEERIGTRPTILVVDYMGLLGWAGHDSARTYERASENARRLKDVALEQSVVILAAVQLSRQAGDGSARPTLDSIRDSGVIEEAADRIIAGWRESAIEDESTKPGTPKSLYLAVLKNRHGPSGAETELRFDDSLRLVEAGNEKQETFPWEDPS